MNWHKIIGDNKPQKYKGYPIQISLRNDDEEWNGFDFHPKDLDCFYEGEQYLYLHIYKKGFAGEYGDLIDTIIIDLK